VVGNDPFELAGLADLADETAELLERAARGTADRSELELIATAQRRLATELRARGERAIRSRVSNLDRRPFDQDAEDET
jgi:hypothetical protein